MTFRRLVYFAALLSLAHALPAMPASMEGCDDPAKPNRPKLDPVYLQAPAKIYERETTRVFGRLEAMEGYPDGLGAEAIVGFIAREKSGLTGAQAHFAKGAAWLREGEADNARYHFLEAVKAEPGAYPAWAGLFMVTPGDKANAAIELFRKASALSPKSPEPYNIIAGYQALVRTHYGPAVLTLEEGLKAIPKPPEYLYQNQAAYIIASPDYAQRLDTLKRNAELLLKVDEGQVNLYISGAFRYLIGDYGGSAASFRRLTDKYERSMPGLYGLAEATFCEGDPDAALRIGEAAYKLMAETELKHKFGARLEAFRREAGVPPAP